MADGLESLFDDIPRSSAAPETPQPQTVSVSSLFDDIQASAPTVIPPVAGAELDDARTRSGGAGIDRLFGVDSGMLGYGPTAAQRKNDPTVANAPEDPYDIKQRQLAEAEAEIARRSQINTDLRNAPLADFTPPPSPLFEFERQRAEAEARRTGQPVRRHAMEPTPEQLAETSALETGFRRDAEIKRGQSLFHDAVDAKTKVLTNQPASQNELRNAVEALAAQAVGVPAGMADAGSIVVRKVAEIVDDQESLARIDETTRQIQSYFNGLARPDASKADEFTSKAIGGIGSTLGFAVTGAIGKGLGLGMTATTALAGALPQAAKQYRDAEAKGASEAQKWFAFATGLGLGATEALPIAAAMERWALGVPGFRQAFRLTMVSGAEETAQEFGQNLGENVVAGLSYDPQRKPTEGLAEASAVGGLTGLVLGGAGSFGNAALNRGGRALHEPAIPLPEGMPALPPELQGVVPQGAQPASSVLGPDPDAQPQRSDPRVELGQILADPRPTAEIRAEMEAKGLVARDPATAPLGIVSLETLPQQILMKARDSGFEIPASQYSVDEQEMLAAAGIHPVETEFGEVYLGDAMVREADRRNAAGEIKRLGQFDNSHIIEWRQAKGAPVGTRTDPVRIDSPEAVTDGAERTAQPTPAQAEAGNYAKRHVKWNGLDISVETEAGSERRGIGEDGDEWSAVAPAPYGYIKRTKGADGDHVDITLGPNPQGRSFIVDQIDPKTRRFDEHKLYGGFDSAEQAQAFYEASFSDGSGPSRIGELTEIPTAQLPQWVDNANLRLPFRYQPPVSAGLTGEQYRDLKQAIATPRQSLAPADLAKQLGASVVDVRAVLQRLAGRNEIRMSSDGRFSRIPQRAYPLELLQFLAQRGGLQAKQAREITDLNKIFLPGFGNIVRPTGRTLDEAREAAVEAGYLREGATVRDLLDAIDWSTRGRKTFSAFDQARVVELDARRLEDGAVNEQLAELEAQFADVVAKYGIDASLGEMIEAAELMRDGLSAEDALVTAIERAGLRELSDANDANWLTAQEWQEFDQAFGISRQAEQQQDDGGLGGIFDDIDLARPQEARPGAAQAGEQAGTGRAQEEGPSPAGQQPRQDRRQEAVARQAGDTDEAVEQQLTETGPWDFNDTYPAPLMGEDAADVVADRLEDAIEHLQEQFISIALQQRQIAALGNRENDGRVKLRERHIAEDRQRIADARAELFGEFTKDAVNAITAEAERRAQQEQRTSDTSTRTSSADIEERKEDPGEAKRKAFVAENRRLNTFTQAERDAAFASLKVGDILHQDGMAKSVTGQIEAINRARPDEAHQWVQAVVRWRDNGKPRKGNAAGSNAYFSDFFLRDGTLYTPGVSELHPPKAWTRNPTEEAGAEGKPQTVIPGAERISQREQAERAADQPMRARRPQREAGGMFDEGNTAAQLFDDIPAAPKAAEKPKGGEPIGTNRYGHPVYEDERGVRSYVADGIRMTENVAVNPRGSVSIDKSRRTDAFQTTDEADAQRAADTAGTIEERIARWKQQDKTWAEVLDLLGRDIPTDELRQAARLWNAKAEQKGDGFQIGNKAPGRSDKISVGGAVAKAKRDAKAPKLEELTREVKNDKDKPGVIVGSVKLVKMHGSGMTLGDMQRQIRAEGYPQADVVAATRAWTRMDDMRDERKAILDKLEAAAARRQGESDLAYFNRIIAQHHQLTGREEIEDLDIAKRALASVVGEQEILTYDPGNKAKITSADIRVMQRPDGWVSGGGANRSQAGYGGNPSIWDREVFKTRNEAGWHAGERALRFFEGDVNGLTIPQKEIDKFRRWLEQEFGLPPGKGEPTPAETRREALETGTPPIEDDRERQRRENVAKIEAQEKEPAKGASNTVFTADKAAAARARLKAKLSGTQLNSGIDPETIQDGLTLAGFHIEAGARSFAAYSKAMIEDMGEVIRPYLRLFYESVRHYPGFDNTGMTSAAEIDAGESAPATTEKPETATPKAEPELTRLQKARFTPDLSKHAQKFEIAEAFKTAFVNGIGFNSIRIARTFAEKATKGAMKPSADTAKLIDEAIELGVVLAAREIVAEAQNPSEAFDGLLKLYELQPNLNVRTSTSIAEQAYSTPVPLAYVASRLAGIDASTTVYEPSAGNGALLIEADTNQDTIANELNADRRAALEYQGFLTLDKDASDPMIFNDAVQKRKAGKAIGMDAVIANPPFGPIKGEDGESKRFRIDERYTTTEIDHAIALRALDAMKDDGRAVLIVGGPNKLADSERARSNAYNGKAKREFYLTLYGEYNVVDHFTVSGDLYAKQGAGWPVDVIVIDGRGKSSLKVPAAQVPPILTTWQDVKGKLDVAKTTAGTDRQAGEPVRGAAADGGRPGADADRGRVAGRGDDSAAVGRRDPGAGRPAGGSVADRGGERTAVRPAQLEPQQRAAAGDARPDGAGVQRRASVIEQSQPSLFDTDSSAETAPAIEAPPQPKPRPKPAPLTPTAADMTKPQVPYRPRSNAHPMETLVPVNMQTAAQEALAALEKRVGNIDEFVAQELGYKPEELSQYFGAEQIDGIALGIDNFAKGAGLIIGDQTGIGKGRQVAGILRWALRNGMTPIFVTEKPNLYADMFRDLTDIGIEDMLGRELKIFMTNSGETVPLDETGKRTLKTPAAGPHTAAMNKMIETGKLDGFDMVFTTYAQMQTVKGEETVRQRFLRAMAANKGAITLDEAHNAGGGGAERVQKKDGKEIMTRAKFVRELLGTASAALYSSATYAKRPDVMDLYFKTDLSLAVDKLDQLAELISKGGIPMQQIVAAMLAKSGQYVRRERSFEGIEYNTPVVEVDTAKYEEFGRNLALIQQFSDEFVAEAVEKMDQQLKEEGRAVAHDGATGNAGASSTNFTAIMHNLINQMLLAMKAQDAGDRAVAALKRGEKPVITLANTNESFIEEYAEGAGIAVGQAIDVSFNDLLARYLERSRQVTIRKPWGGDVERLRLTDEHLGPLGTRAFNEAMRAIKQADFSGLPVSPIDWIRSTIVKAGYSVTEITGRSLTIDYGAGSNRAPILKARPMAEKSIRGRRAAIGGFNAGTIDAIILNQSGSTGLSLHASARVQNQNPRRMILAQAEGNIDTHMQMLGRVNRTGQVVKPIYDQLVAGIPAERRPAAILAKKMASLNANTTGARDSAVTAKDVPDFMNAYGDRIAAMVMRDNPDLNWRLGEPVSLSEETSAEGAMRKVTGRIPLLPLQEQEDLYDLLTSEYKALIEQLEASGQNIIEAKTLELDAKTVGVMEAKAGKDKDSPFADAVYFEQIDAKRLGKPMSSEQVLAAVAKGIGVELPSDGGEKALATLATLARGEQKEIARHEIAAFEKFAKAEEAGAKKEDTAKNLRAKFADQLRVWTELHRTLTPGQGVVLKTDGGNFYGIVTKTEFKGKAKNPLSPSAWRATVALADPARQITIPFSQLYTAAIKPEKPAEWDVEVETANSIGTIPLLSAFDDMQIERREERVVATGNIPAAYAFVDGKGQIVNFADNQGRLRQAIMMPRGFDAGKFLKAKNVPLPTGDKVKAFMDKAPKAKIASTDGFISLRKTPQGDIEINVDSAKANGGRYFLDRRVLEVARRDFVRQGGFMRNTVPPYRAGEVIDALIKAGAYFEAADHLDEARAIVGNATVFSAVPNGWDTTGETEHQWLTDAEMAQLGKIVERVAGEVELRWPEAIRVPPGSQGAKAWGKADQEMVAGGYFNPVDDVIAISQTAGGPQVAYHEAFHRLQAWALTDAQKAVLKAEVERLKQLIKLSPLGRDVEIMSQKEIEADAFGIFANARDLKQGVTGFPARVRMIFDKIYKLVRAAKNWLKGHGFQTYETVFEKSWRGELAAAANDGVMLDQPRSSDPAYTVPPGAQNTPINRRSLLDQALAKGQPIDSAFRIPFDWFGGLDREGRWKPGLWLDDKAKHAIVEAKLDPNGRLGWLAPLIENARQGLIDRYGLDDAYVQRDRARANDERAVLGQGAEILQSLFARNLSLDESKVLQAMLTGETVKDGEFGALAEPIQQAIDQLGAEAVHLGLISAESYERNRGAYLHRNYMKDQAMPGLMGMLNRNFTSRRKRIIGDQMKGRGIFLDLSQERLLRDDPEFPAAKRGEAMKGEKFRLIQRFTVQHNTDGTTTEKETKRIWWPADRPVPDKWRADRDGGTWEVRGVARNGDVTLWRDYSKAERLKMGEILDARYNIGKTFALMAHDLATGRFYKDIAENEDWSQAQVPDQGWKNASEYGRFWNDPTIEWVKVPDEAIPNSGGKKKWGALAGRFVRAEIWRDINETAIAQQPSLWRKLLGIWKLNKTARSPITHMNNVMSNVMFMDIADIRARDLIRGIRAFVKEDAMFKEAQQAGAFGNDMMAVEFRKDVLGPLLAELQKQQEGQGAAGLVTNLSTVGIITNHVWDAAKRLGGKVAAFDQKMIDLYRIEDEVFRMATYIRRREMGDTAQQAADFARRQFLDYDIKAPWVQAARNSVLPFISYPYRAIPLIAEALMYRPWKLAKYFALTYGANAIAYGLDGDGDEERERAALRKDEQGRLWTGTYRMMRMPWRDANGLPVFMDIRRWTPAGDIFEANSGNSALPIPNILMPGGPLMIGAEFVLNKVGFTGKTITNERTDTWLEQGGKTGDWLWKSLMPNAPWIPSSWSSERIGRAFWGGTDRAGNPLSMKEAAAFSFGVKLAGRDIEEGFRSKFFEFRKVERELKEQARALAGQRARNLISQTVYEQEMANIVRKAGRNAALSGELAQQARPKAERERTP